MEWRLKKNGQLHKIQPSMHRVCANEYWRAQNASCQLNSLRKRDGDRCCECGPGGKFLEVDHKVPLWKVADLPPARRREYFLLGNLQLLCGQCHKLKSAKEAAERAHHKRLVKGKKRRGRAMQGQGFDTRLRKRMDGTVEVRT